jgi:hypothetical protein
MGGSIMDYTRLNVTTIDAILSLNANAKVSVINKDDGTYTIEWLDGTAVISNADIDAEVTRLETEWTNHAYQRNRLAKYDALNQFELISDDSANGTTTHKDAIAAIKAEFPKP